jgi:primase-polymerase (primpol)-like protein
MVRDISNVRNLRQFVCWRYEERAGEVTKVPYSPLTGKRASSTDPATWANYTEAVAAYREDRYDGIGFVFTKDDPFCGVDLDKCRNPETGEIEPWAQDIVQELNSYTEVSPSGRGLHILVRGELPDGRNRKERIEMYSHSRYFTLTGRLLEGTRRTIEDRQEQLLSLRHRVLGEQPSTNGQVTLHPKIERKLSDQDIIEKATEADNGEKFRRLWNGTRATTEALARPIRRCARCWPFGAGPNLSG